MNKLLIGVIIIIVVCCVCLGWLYKNYKSQQHQCRMQKKYDDILFKAGDIILFRHDSINYFHMLTTGDEFSHIGIVCEYSGKLCLLEAVMEDDLKILGNAYGGANISPLKERLATYDGYVCVRNLNKHLSAQQINAITAYYKKQLNNNFCDDIVKYFTKVAFRCLFTDEHSDKCLFCSKFVLDILKEIGISKVDATHCYRPASIDKLLNDDIMVDGYYYDEPVDVIMQ